MIPKTPYSMRVFCLAVLLSCEGISAANQPPAPVILTPDHANGVYTLSETVTWNIKVSGDGLSSSGSFSWKLQKNGLSNLNEGTGKLSDGKATISGKLTEPGWLYATVSMKGADGKDITGNGGAVFAPEVIKASVPSPSDFDSFWQEKIKELSAVPMNAKIEQADSGDPDVDYFKVTMDNIRGTHIYGQLAKPKKGSNFPALVQFQYAGVYALQKSWVTGPAKSGWLAFNITAHDLPIDKSEDFYTKAGATTLKDYVKIGWTDRESSYFLRMLLGCYRAVDFVRERPEWGKKVLLVKGTSQGGVQSFAAAGLHPAVTALAVEVPAGCDFSSIKAGRRVGWPYWGNAPDDIRNKVLSVSEYFDAAHFAERVKAKSLVAAGLIDTTCPPTAVLSAYNAIKGPKEIVYLPQGTHKNNHQEYYPAYTRFLNGLLGK